MKISSINSKKLAVTGVVIVIGLTIALAIVGYYIYNTESERVDQRPDIYSEPLEPTPRTVSPEAVAPSSPAPDGESAPATAP